ncbi:MAG: photosystem II reaction center protein T [Aphanocapsa lilacina HA4352-LM1]|jgi:photosystem II PsbT protein|uniref:Photosystem II protein n=1 Tax=Gloeobacter violaceus (strain ATCC 29082 / PCC 7421) TaxID=251221 RepID=Q7NCH9_GLOVI|nr:photosystem II reaction center protein T [Gloeobacter violaceus]MBW4697891.1 photosystem II reaction center protein T [Aphanocapsa lilacina HA4352-LM1]BAC90941.1 photosystem II protein [Gloeobacter violaceus PCC 7421]
MGSSGITTITYVLILALIILAIFFAVFFPEKKSK